MRKACFALLAVLVAAASAGAGDYPRVRTFSGGFYGPTQAHYQYQRRYGRPWHGQGGFTSHGYGRHYGGSFPYSYGWPGYSSFGFGFGVPLAGFGYSSYGGSYIAPGCGLFGFGAAPLTSYPLGLAVTPPSLTLASPGVYQPFWSTNPYVNDGLLNNGQLWQQEVPDLLTPQTETLGVEPLGNAPVLPAPSTPEAQLRSLQQQQHGDARLQQLDYLQAYLRYQESAETAADRAEPHYRMGIALSGMKRFDKAVREFKLASDLDPGWVNSTSLDTLLGADNQIGKVQLKKRVADWALADAYDADRLYLLGTLLHLDGDPDRARILIDTAVALVGHERHLAAFGSPPQQTGPTQVVPSLPPTTLPPQPNPPQPNDPQLPAPQPSQPQADDIPELPQEPNGSGSSAQPQVIPKAPPTQQILPSVPQPSGPVFPTSLN